MIIDQFFNFIIEVMQNEKNDLINVIADVYSIEKKTYKSNKNNVAQHKILTNEIIQTLRML